MTQLHAWQQMGLVGDYVALQFANTVDDDGKSRTRDGVPTWPLLLDWARAAQVLSPSERAALMDEGDAEAELERLHNFREVIWRSFRALALGTIPAEADRGTLSAQGREAVASADLAPTGEALDWHIEAANAGAATVRARLSLGAVTLAADPDTLARLRECKRCTALFVDTGRGRGRRWCRMATCGNRDKVARHRGRAG